ncbi:MAG TPA: glycosyltransferase [Polyangia bacterium]|nr:glycosyltransferase [Polyangia bacterium]
MAEASPRPTAEPEISVVLSVGNDEDRVGHHVRSVADHLRRLGRSFEIVAVNDGSTDNSLSIATLLAGTVPELRVLARNSAGRAFLRGASEARGSVLVLLSANSGPSLAPLGWALSRLAAGRDAVILRGRYIVARRLATLPVIVRATGPGLFFESIFERRAQDLGVDVVGSRPRRQTPLLLRPVLRFLAA